MPLPEKSAAPARSDKMALASLIEVAASFQVPHSWFTHYYIVSVASSCFWAVQILTQGRVFSLFAAYSPNLTTGTMTANQVLLAWLLMAFQGTRRLYESLALSKRSQSEMWIGVWALGIAYYIAIGIAVWIEGIGMTDSILDCYWTTDLASCFRRVSFSYEPVGVLQAFPEDHPQCNHFPHSIRHPACLSQIPGKP